MILSLRIKNFKSYRDEAVFTMEAAEDESLSNNYTVIDLEGGETVWILHTAVIIGANASGKSNVIWAFRALTYLVRTSRDFNRTMKLEPYDGFAFDDRVLGHPVEMSIQFIINRRRYEYDIYFDDIIRKESLYRIVHEEKYTVFFRESNEGEESHHVSFGEGWEHSIPDWATMDVFPNHLILSDIASKQANELNDINELLSHLNVFITPVNIQTINKQIAPMIIKTSRSEVFRKLTRLVRIADLGVTDISMHRHDESEFSFPDFVQESERRRFMQENEWEFRLYHRVADNHAGKSGFLELRRESMGTQHLFGMGALVLAVLGDGGLLVYDELNTALHPEVMRLLVKLFQSPESNPKHAQLIFTTHDTSVLGEQIFRADQVWLAEKDVKSCSHLYSVHDFEGVPMVPPMETWYRSGRFGALPNINNIHYIFTGDIQDEKIEEPHS